MNKQEIRLQELRQEIADIFWINLEQVQVKLLIEE